MPGVYTLLLAVLAGVVPTMEKWYKHKWVKITYGVVLGMLCLLEVTSIKNDREIQDRKHEKELTVERQRFDQVFQLIQTLQSGQNIQINAETALLQENRRAQQTQLKIRALELSRDIGEFTTRVNMEAVGLPHPTPGLANSRDPAWAQWEAQLENVHHNAVAQYNTKFGASVNDIVKQLQKRGVLESSKECDTSLDMQYNKRPGAQFLYVMGCAQDLERAASKLP
jgi:hypothetical protein